MLSAEGRGVRLCWTFCGLFLLDTFTRHTLHDLEDLLDVEVEVNVLLVLEGRLGPDHADGALGLDRVEPVAEVAEVLRSV